MFLVVALPRSRTFWLSRCLSYGDYECGHEEARHLRSVADAKVWLAQNYRGSCETSIAPFWRIINHVNPELRVVVVRRPVAESIKSLMTLDMRGVGAFDEELLTKNMLRLDAKLSQIEKRMPHVLSVNFHDLDNESTIRAVFKHCLPYDFDRAWWESIRHVNLQCNMRALTRYAMAYKSSLSQMEKTISYLSRAELLCAQPQSSDGVIFQQETFDDWIRDGQHLFAEHLIVVGEPPDNWENKNLPLMKKLCEAGAMQITTARCNGKMFGYLAAVINPSLETRNATAGLHTTFYVSKEMPGIGMKLQRASIAALKARGAGTVVFHEGVRGDGPRMGAIYKRLGAQEFGRLYRMDLEGA